MGYLDLVNNSSQNISGSETMPYNKETGRSSVMIDLELVFNVVAFIMVAVGILGNSVVFISGWRLPIIRKKSVTTGSRYYIMNLALADLCVVVVALFTNLIFMRHSWSLGLFMCKMLLPLRDVFMVVSLATITALSLERYWLITRPLHHVPNKRAAKYVLCGIWLVSYLSNGIPLLLITRLEQIGDRTSCGYTWPSVKSMKIHVCFGLAIILVTFVIVTFCYIAIAKTLKEIYKKRKSTMSDVCDEEGNKQVVTLILRSKRLVKMLIVVVVTFSVCTLPGVLYVLVHFFHDVTFKNQEVVYVFFQCMMIAGNAFNPIILLMMASEYRSCIKEFLTLLRRWKRHCCSFMFLQRESFDRSYHDILYKNQVSSPV